jgi:hypothetical protein
LFLIEDAEARWARFSGVELRGGAWRRFGATGLELREHDGEFRTVADTFFYYRENCDARKVWEEMF